MNKKNVLLFTLMCITFSLNGSQASQEHGSSSRLPAPKPKNTSIEQFASSYASDSDSDSEDSKLHGLEQSHLAQSYIFVGPQNNNKAAHKPMSPLGLSSSSASSCIQHKDEEGQEMTDLRSLAPSQSGSQPNDNQLITRTPTPPPPHAPLSISTTTQAQTKEQVEAESLAAKRQSCSPPHPKHHNHHKSCPNTSDNKTYWGLTQKQYISIGVSTACLGTLFWLLKPAAQTRK